MPRAERTIAGRVSGTFCLLAFSPKHIFPKCCGHTIAAFPFRTIELLLDFSFLCMTAKLQDLSGSSLNAELLERISRFVA